MQKQQTVEEATNNYVSYKIYLSNSDEKRRLGFKKTPTFEMFSEQLRSLFLSPDLQQQQQQGGEEGPVKVDNQRTMKIKYIDEENDLITVSSAKEWQAAVQVLESFPIKRIYVSFEDDGQKFAPSHQLPFARNHRGNNNNKPHFCKRGLAAMEPRQLPEDVEQIPPSSIEALKEGSLVHLRSKVSGKNLRAKKDGTIDFLGGKGKKATFVVHLGRQYPNAIRFQSLEDPKRWIRINKKGEPDSSGKGGIFTEFVLLPPKAHWKKNNNNNNNNKMNKWTKCPAPYEDELKEPFLMNTTTVQEASPLPLVCLRSVTMGLQLGSFPDGSVKDPKRVGRGNRAQFFIVPKV
jgi:hypothetical protein